MKSSLKETTERVAVGVLAIGIRARRGPAAASAFSVLAQCGPAGCAAEQRQSARVSLGGPPPSSGGVFPLSQVRRGMTGTAWTVFSGSKPEAMEVEILGVLRGARGPGQDMILAQLHGAKPEYTGVVAGMSGSPVYIGNKLLGALSYRIGQFSKEPIAGITPIEQMLEVRDLPADNQMTAADGNGQAPGASAGFVTGRQLPAPEMNFQMMETPLVMSGFRPEAIRLWQKQMAGTSLAEVAAGGMGGSSGTAGDPARHAKRRALGSRRSRPWSRDRRSVRNWSAATWRSRPPAPSPISIRSGCWPAAIPSCRRGRFRCP